MIVVTVPNSFIDFPWFQMVLTVHSASWGEGICVCAADSETEPSPDGTALLFVIQGLMLSFSALSMCDFCSCILFFEQRKFDALSLECKKNLVQMFLSDVPCEIMSAVTHWDVEDPETEKFQKYVTCSSLLFDFASQ